MNFTVYKTTNLINGKIYIGQHQSKKPFLEDGYIGSGTAITRAIKKYSKSNFKCEILCDCDDFEMMDFIEEIMVDLDFINSPNTYNLKTGGSGVGSMSEETKTKMKNTHSTHKIKTNHIARMVGNQYNLGKKRSDECRAEMSRRNTGDKHRQFGKPHTDEAKRINSESQKGRTKPIVKCTHCEKQGGANLMKRYHFDNCKHRV